MRSSFNVWGSVNYPLTLLTNIRTLAFYTPKNNTLGNPPGENSTQKQYFWKSPWEKRNPETILLEIPLGKIQLTRYQFPKIGGADTPQPIKLYSGMVKWKDNFFKLESCPIAVIISVKSGAHPVLHTVFHHFPQEIIHSPKQNFAQNLNRS